MKAKALINPNSVPVDCTFVGLLKDEHGDIVAVVRVPGFGLMLETVHPSNVEIVEQEGRIT